jgi:hypothetical protein
MSYCTPCPPCDTNFPLLCEPLETTANGKRLVVEDSAACQKTIQSPVAQQVLKTDGAGNLTWTNGASGTVLRKDATGLVEFATLNSVLQSGPVDLGSQPLTTTGAVSTGAATISGSITATSAVFSVSSSSDAVRITQTGSGNALVVEDSTNPDSSPFAIAANGFVGIGTLSPIQRLHITGEENVISLVQSNGGINTFVSSSDLLNAGFVGTGTNQPLNIVSNNVARVVVKAQGQVRFVPLAADPTSPEAGDVYYNSTTNKLRCYNGSIWNDLF